MARYVPVRIGTESHLVLLHLLARRFSCGTLDSTFSSTPEFVPEVQRRLGVVKWEGQIFG